jgi:hypothetical protein
MPASCDSLFSQASAADHAHAAALIAHVVRDVPEAVLWRPGIPSWGICVIAGSSRAVVALDGCLQAIAGIYPGRLPGRTYALDTVARLLLGPLQIKHLEGRSLFRCRLPPAANGGCCIMISDEDLPWLSTKIVCAQADSLSWRGPELLGGLSIRIDAGSDNAAADGRKPPAEPPPPGSR